MPRRWLSIRSRPAHTNDPVSLNISNNFDFAFTATPPVRSTVQHPSPDEKPADSESGRPSTSNGLLEGRAKKRLRIDIPDNRPRTSDSIHTPNMTRTDPQSRPENNLIGLAFGSPSHPPPNFNNIYSNIMLSEPEHTFRTDNRLIEDPSPPQPNRWKKLGALFGPKPSNSKRKEFNSTALSKSQVNHSENGVDSHLRGRNGKLVSNQFKLPSTKPTPIPTSYTVECTHEKLSPQEFNQKVEQAMGSSNNSARSQSGNRQKGTERSLETMPPKLEIEIPSLEMERYSVMFQGVRADSQSSSLLARRDKALGSLKRNYRSHEDKISEEDGPAQGLVPPPRMRRQTSPTTSRSPAIYSLFPPCSPAPVKIVGNVSFSDSPLKRSATSPARLSPMRDNFVNLPSTIDSKCVPQDDLQVMNSEDITAATELDRIWSAAHSIKSSISSATTMDEIFFDVKSLRDSKGIEGSQFVMTRPDSAVVQLARTRSKLNAATRAQKSKLGLSDESNEEKHSSVNTAVFDEVIAAVERFADPGWKDVSNTENDNIPPLQDLIRSELQESENSTPDLRSASVESFEEQKRLPPEPMIAHPIPPHHRSGKSSFDHVIATMPSPVPEVSEELPTREQSPQPLKHPAISRVAAIKRVDTPIEDSPTIPQGPPSTIPPKVQQLVDPKKPPVPEKDAKFIPISKYATKRTVAAIERTGVRTTRPNRAASESLPVSQYMPIRLAPERAATMPLQTSTTTTKSSSAGKYPERKASKQALTSIPAIVRTVPAAEVSVARTVSLTRKQSARVLVPGPKLVARREQARARVEAVPARHRPAVPASNTKKEQEASQLLGKDKTRWELVDKRALSPVVVQAERGHRPGVSMNLVVESI